MARCTGSLWCLETSLSRPPRATRSTGWTGPPAMSAGTCTSAPRCPWPTCRAAASTRSASPAPWSTTQPTAWCTRSRRPLGTITCWSAWTWPTGRCGSAATFPLPTATPGITSNGPRSPCRTDAFMSRSAGSMGIAAPTRAQSCLSRRRGRARWPPTACRLRGKAASGHQAVRLPGRMARSTWASATGLLPARRLTTATRSRRCRPACVAPASSLPPHGRTTTTTPTISTSAPCPPPC